MRQFCAASSTSTTFETVMEPERALEILQASALDRPETFYAPDNALPLGAGLLIDDVEFPIFDPDSDRFAVVKGLIYLLSHECDLDPANARVLNDMALVCPVLAIPEFLVDCERIGIEDHEVGATLGNLAKRLVSRAVYFPSLHDRLPLGGLLYLNKMASTPVARLLQGGRLCTLTAIGVQTVDLALDNHLRRPKAEPLPLEGAHIRNPSTTIGVRPK